MSEGAEFGAALRMRRVHMISMPGGKNSDGKTRAHIHTVALNEVTL